LGRIREANARDDNLGHRCYKTARRTGAEGEAG